MQSSHAHACLKCSCRSTACHSVMDSVLPTYFMPVMGISTLSEEIMKLCVSVGGSLSGEHGIGYEKKDFMGLVFDEPDLDAMMRVKRVFNPSGLLNPDKI